MNKHSDIENRQNSQQRIRSKTYSTFRRQPRNNVNRTRSHSRISRRRIILHTSIIIYRVTIMRTRANIISRRISKSLKVKRTLLRTPTINSPHRINLRYLHNSPILFTRFYNRSFRVKHNTNRRRRIVTINNRTSNRIRTSAKNHTNSGYNNRIRPSRNRTS